MKVTIGPVKPDEQPAVVALLIKSDLPKDGLGDHWATTLVARDGSRIVGSAALELYDQAALLRSVAVEQSLQGRGLGQRLTRAALHLARQRKITTVYLLTETAAPFFERLGFRPISRSEVSPHVKRSVEFTSACPESAQAMVLNLSLKPEICEKGES